MRVVAAGASRTRHIADHSGVAVAYLFERHIKLHVIKL